MIAVAMNEKDKSSDRYELMSPRELNSAFIQVYRQIPKMEMSKLKGIYKDKGLNALCDEILEVAGRRQGSEYKERLLRIHSNLIDRSHLSPLFQDVVKKRFFSKYDFDLGLSLEPPEVPTSDLESTIRNLRDFGLSLKPTGIPASYLEFTTRDLLDLDNPESGGVFDPETAKKIERKAYLTKLSIDIYFRELLARKGEQIAQTSLDLEGQMRGEWLNQFLQKHGELP